LGYVAGMKARVVEQVAGAVVPFIFSLRSTWALRTLAKIFEWLSLTEVSKERARKMQWLFRAGHPFLEWMKRLSRELNPRSRSIWIRNVYVLQYFRSKAVRMQFAKEHGFEPPHFIAISPTGRCNYRCIGCWAGEYTQDQDMPEETFERLVGEARDRFGNHWITILGGEPLLRTDLFPIYEKYRDIFFLTFTNGSLVTEEMADHLTALGNLGLMFSVDGWEGQTDAHRRNGAWRLAIEGMARLRRRGLPFGYAATATRDNVETLWSDAFVDYFIDHGALYGWYFHYCPIGRNPNIEMMLTAEQHTELRHRIYHLRGTRPIFLADFWNDGPETGGCLAGGKCYLHVNAKGDVEPCVFVHLAVDNIRDKSLTEALKSPFFRGIRAQIPYDGNEIRPCMIFDRPEVLRDHYRRYKPYTTHAGADAYLTDPKITAFIDRLSEQYRQLADRDWASGNWMRIFPDPPGVTKIIRAEIAKEKMVRIWNGSGTEMKPETPITEKVAYIRNRPQREGKTKNETRNPFSRS
jgi:MoaA/NifB/PqqE/SkfB family radical SAM enzyme